jgi:hypothetical protein
MPAEDARPHSDTSTEKLKPQSAESGLLVGAQSNAVLYR